MVIVAVTVAPPTRSLVNSLPLPLPLPLIGSADDAAAYPVVELDEDDDRDTHDKSDAFLRKSDHWRR